MAKPNVKYTITAEDKSRRVVESVEARLKSAAKVGAAALATSAVAAAAGIAAISIKAAQAADNVGKLSTQLGISVKSLSEFEFIAGQTGVRFDTLTMALQRSTRRIAEAAQGTGEAQTALKELGISAQALNQLDPAAQFEVLAKQLGEVTNEADQVRLAFKLFDSEGVRLLRTIKQTGGDFGVLRSRAKELGAVLDSDLTKKGAAVQDSMAEISTALSGVGNTLLANFGPAIVSVANNLVDFINNARRAAADIGLITLRVAELSDAELTTEIEVNRARIKGLEVIKEGSRSIVGRKAAAQEILEIEKRNLELQTQLSELDKQRAESAKTSALQKATLIEPVSVGQQETQQQDSTRFDKSQEEFQRYLDTLMTEEEALAASYARRLEIINANTVAGSELNISLKEKEYARLEKGMLEHEAKLGNIEAKGILARQKFEQKTTKQKTKFVLGELASLTSGVAQHNKTLFKINKIASIANAIINTAQGVSLALASYPPPVSFAMAAAVAAAGYAQVSAIKNTAFGGGGTGTTPSAAGSTPTVNDYPIETTSTAPVIDDIVPQRDSVINISFNPGITDTNAVRDFITEDLSEALRDGAGLDVRVVAQ